ncbi:MAG: hypothetical protein Q9162_001675 [Coniocarpon cinnabarinum]
MVKPNVHKDLKSPRAEGIKRGLPTVASKEETNPAGTARTLTTAHAPTRPQPMNPSLPQKSTREINTSRSLRSPKDTSTIDFAYLPSEPAPVPMDNVNLRVPLIPDGESPVRTGAHATPTAEYDTVMRAQVVTAAGEQTFVSAPSVMSDVHDNNSVRVDYGALADKMEQTASQVSDKARDTQGTVKQIWNGMVDDIFGPRRATA